MTDQEAAQAQAKASAEAYAEQMRGAADQGPAEVFTDKGFVKFQHPSYVPGRRILGVVATGGEVFAQTNEGLYRVVGNELVRVWFPDEKPKDDIQHAPFTAEEVGNLVREAFETKRTQVEDPDQFWLMIGEYVVSRGGVDASVSTVASENVQVEPGPVTFDPHENSVLMQDDKFRDTMGEIRTRNGL
jgi:hypothetical protein